MEVFLKKYLIIITSISIPSLIIYKKSILNGYCNKCLEINKKFCRKLPLRIFSRYFGKISETNVPIFLRTPLYFTFAWIFGINFSEIEMPLKDFSSFSDFFARSLDIEKYRPISDSDFISPVDGKVTSFGKLTEITEIDAKGEMLSLEQLTGSKHPNKTNFHYISFYLSPGDYHRFHSPVDWNIFSLRHISGELLPVSPRFAKFFPNLFCINERVVLEGRWKHGYCSFIPIGAFNVGSIKLSNRIEPSLKTNLPNIEDGFGNFDFSKETSGKGINVKKNEEMGLFRFGSSVVLVFEVPKQLDFLFRVRKNERIKVGEEIGVIY